MKKHVLLFQRLIPWLKLASEYSLAFIVTRLIAAVSGLLLVRILPIEEYGIYTLLLACFTFICTFANLGATEALSFFRWRSIQKNKSWMPYYHTVLRFRRLIFSFSFIGTIIYFYYTATHVGVSNQVLVLGVVLLGIASWLVIDFSIISYVFKLENRFRFAYLLDITNETTKLLCVGMIWFSGMLNAQAGMVSVVAGTIATFLLSRQLFKKHFSRLNKPSLRQFHHYRRALIGQILPVIPGSIHFAIQAPLITWLAAYFGSVENVAKVGALGRLGLLIGMISGFAGTVFIPRITNIKDNDLYLIRYLQWWMVMLVIGGALLFFVSVLPEAMLFLLGGSYSGLHNELIVSAATAIVYSFGAVAFSINRARGWVKYQPYGIVLVSAGQLLLVVFLDFSKTIGVLLFSLGTASIALLYQVAINFFGFKSTTGKKL